MGERRRLLHPTALRDNVDIDVIFDSVAGWLILKLRNSILCIRLITGSPWAVMDPSPIISIVMVAQYFLCTKKCRFSFVYASMLIRVKVWEKITAKVRIRFTYC